MPTRRSSGTLEPAAPAPDTRRGSQAQGRPPVPEVKTLPPLPTEPRQPSGQLGDKTIMIYGPPGVGKSTLASEFPKALFFDVEGGLSDLAVYSVPVTDWTSFLHYCGQAADSDRFQTIIIDTVDMLAIHCSKYMTGQLGIIHESDADWGKGWTMVRNEYTRALAKLAALPEKGLVLVSHSKETEIKTRNKTYTKVAPTLTGQIRETTLNITDITIYIDFDGDDRIMHTKPDESWEAKERGRNPRLPAHIRWPMNTSGYNRLQSAWEKGGKDGKGKD